MKADSLRVVKKHVSNIRGLEVKTSFSNVLFRFGLAVISFELFSGLWLMLEKGFSTRIMTLVLAHTFLGYLLVVSLIMLLHRHQMYRKAWPSRSYDFLAGACALTLALGIATGIWMHWLGFAGSIWIWWAHLVSSFLHVLFLTLYIIQTIKLGAHGLSPIIKKKFFHQLLKISFTIFIVCAFFISLFETIQSLQRIPNPSKSVDNYSLTLQTSDIFFPSALKTTSGGFYQENHYTNSQSCGTQGCHGETVKQWQESTHYRTPGPFVHRVEQLLIEEGQNKTLFKMVPSSHFEMIRNAKPGREIFRMCAGCHAPVALLSGNVDPKAPLETFEKFEGVSCKVCHTMKENDRPKQGPGSYELTAPTKLFFEDWTSPLGQHLYHTLIRARPEDHKKMFMKPGYKDSKICSSCHFTNQYESWATGYYHNPNDQSKTKSCQNCHMPQTETDQDISAASKGTIANHRYLSAGFAMAKYFGLEDQFEKSKSFMQSKKMSVQVFAPSVAAKGRSLRFTVRVANIGVGHFFPSGPEADLAETWVQVDIFGKDNQLLHKFGDLDKNHYLDSKKNRIWRVTNLDNYGRGLENDRHRSWKFAIDILDLIPPKAFSDVNFIIPSSRIKNQTELKVQARLMYRRPNQAFADWALGKGKFIIPIIEVATNERGISLSDDQKLVDSSAENYRTDLQKIEPGFKKTNDQPAVTSRIVVEDWIIMKNAKRLLLENKPDDAIVLLKQVSPSFLKNNPAGQKVHQSFMRDAKTIKKREANPRELDPGF